MQRAIRKRKYDSRASVVALNDAETKVTLDAGCLLMQAAHQDRINPAAPRLFVDDRLLNLMSPLNQSALFVHEWLLNAAITHGVFDIRVVQEIVGHIYDKSFEAEERKDFAAELAQLGVALQGPLRQDFDVFGQKVTARVSNCDDSVSLTPLHVAVLQRLIDHDGSNPIVFDEYKFRAFQDGRYEFVVQNAGNNDGLTIGGRKIKDVARITVNPSGVVTCLTGSLVEGRNHKVIVLDFYPNGQIERAQGTVPNELFEKIRNRQKIEVDTSAVVDFYLNGNLKTATLKHDAEFYGMQDLRAGDILSFSEDGKLVSANLVTADSLEIVLYYDAKKRRGFRVGRIVQFDTNTGFALIN